MSSVARSSTGAQFAESIDACLGHTDAHVDEITTTDKLDYAHQQRIGGDDSCEPKNGKRHPDSGASTDTCNRCDRVLSGFGGKAQD